MGCVMSTIKTGVYSDAASMVSSREITVQGCWDIMLVLLLYRVNLLRKMQQTSMQNH